MAAYAQHPLASTNGLISDVRAAAFSITLVTLGCTEITMSHFSAATLAILAANDAEMPARVPAIASYTQGEITEIHLAATDNDCPGQTICTLCRAKR